MDKPVVKAVKTPEIDELRWYDDVSPKVSIVILNLNKSEMTKDCLRKLWEHTESHGYEIIVVDNGSIDEEHEKLASFSGPFQLIRLGVNRYFGEGNNVGAERAKGEFVLFLNNDVLVTPNWLDPLLKPFEIHEDCGATGPKFVYPDGDLQEAGALLDSDGTAVQMGKFQDPATPRFNIPRTVDYISAATLLMKRDHFEMLRGFDFIFEPAYYEDADLCLKLGTLGYKVYYVPTSHVIHFENATSGEKGHGLALHNIVDINRGKFIRRWHNFLHSGRHEGIDFVVDIDRIKANPKTDGNEAGVYTPYNIIPGGGERYLLTIVQYLSERGYSVTLIVPELYSRLRISAVAKILGLDIQNLDIMTQAQAEARELFDVFVAMGNHVYPPIEGLGKRNYYHCQFPFPWEHDVPSRDKIWLANYECLIVNSEFTKAHTIARINAAGLEERPVHVLAPPVPLIEREDAGQRKGILSVGRFFAGGHCKRQDDLIRAYKVLVENGFSGDLHLVGSLHPEAVHRDYLEDCRRLAGDLPVRFHIDASKIELANLYKTTSIYWHGSGLNIDAEKHPENCEHFGISIVEAMASGLVPFVVDTGGPASIVEDHKNGFHFNSIDGLVKSTQSFLQKSDDEIEALRKAAVTRSADFGEKAFYSGLDKILKLPAGVA